MCIISKPPLTQIKTMTQITLLKVVKSEVIYIKCEISSIYEKNISKPVN